jgi:hypothetical protein
MSGRRRRGRRRPWDQREGTSPNGQPRFGTDGPPNSSAPPRGSGGYTGATGQPRWQGASAGQSPRGPDRGGKLGRTRWSNGSGAPPSGGQRRWAPGHAAQGAAGQYTQGARGGGPYAQAPRWARGGRPQGRPHDQQRRPEPPPTVPPGSAIDAFDLFCAYHLGITADGSYRIQNIHEVARRFGTNAAALRQTLAAYGMDAEDLVHSGFDLASAQIDIMVAPEGISRRELARPLYDEFKNAPRKVRDWAKEMEEADRQIERTIGSDGRWSPTSRDPAGKQS